MTGHAIGGSPLLAITRRQVFIILDWNETASSRNAADVVRCKFEKYQGDYWRRSKVDVERYVNCWIWRPESFKHGARENLLRHPISNGDALWTALHNSIVIVVLPTGSLCPKKLRTVDHTCQAYSRYIRNVFEIEREKLPKFKAGNRKPDEHPWSSFRRQQIVWQESWIYLQAGQ